MEVIEVTPALVEGAFSAAEARPGLVYEHLRKYCERFSPLPAITVVLRDGRLTAVRGLEYLSIARDLGRPSIRASLDGVTYRELRERGVPGVLDVVSQALLEGDDAAAIRAWHVLFFDAPLNAALVSALETRLARFLEASLPPVLGEEVETSFDSSVDVAQGCFEARFLTPVTDYAWMTLYRGFLFSIHRDVLPIATFQGHRFID